MMECTKRNPVKERTDDIDSARTKRVLIIVVEAKKGV
jgi:hypothetical protein